MSSDCLGGPVGTDHERLSLGAEFGTEVFGELLGSEEGVLVVISVKFSTVTSSAASNCVLLDILKVFIKKEGSKHYPLKFQLFLKS